MKKFTSFVLVLVIAVSLATGFTAAIIHADIITDNKIMVDFATNRLDSYTTISVPEGKNFKILQLSDPQLKYPVNDYEKFGGSNKKTMTMIDRMLSAIKPDLVIYTGDLVMSQIVNNWQYIQLFADMMERHKTYWTLSFGEHDVEASYVYNDTVPGSIFGQDKKEVIISRLQTYPHCLITRGDADNGGGIGNHIINLYSKKTKEHIYSLIMMDTVYEPDVDETFHKEKTPKQVIWYEENIKTISQSTFGQDSSSVIKSMIFTHIAVPEIWKATDIIYGNILEGAVDEKHASCTLFNKAISLGSTKAMFFGHHHNNDARVVYKGVDLVFGQHSGFSHYYRIAKSSNSLGGTHYDMSDIFNYGDARGGTLITISSKGLNSTYTIEPLYARDIIEWEDIKIDYNKTYEFLINEENATVSK